MKKAIIIGCGNVGFATIERLVSDNWFIYVFDLKQPDYLSSLMETHNNIVFCTMNACDSESIESAYSSLSDDIKADLVLCTVGVNKNVSPMTDFTIFQKTVETNVLGNILPIKGLVNRSLIGKGGKIIVIGSTSGHFAGIALNPYSVSKWILVNICESLQHELKPCGISLDIVNPRSIQNVHSNVFQSKTGVTVDDVVTQILRGGSRSFVPKYYCFFHLIERCFSGLFDLAFGLKPLFIRKKAYPTSYKNVLITGASSGLGKSLVRQYAPTARMIFCVARNTKKLDSLKYDMENEFKCKIIPISADLFDLRSIDLILSTIGENNVDLLINNAGQHVSGSVLECDTDAIRRSMIINCLSHICLTAKILIRQTTPLCAVNILSTTAISGRTSMGIYSSPKAGLWAWTKVLRRNVGKEHHIVEVIPATFTSSLSTSGVNYNRNAVKGRSIVSSSKDNLTSDKVASIIVAGLQHRKEKIYAPKVKVSLFIMLEAFCPSLFRKLFS